MLLPAAVRRLFRSPKTHRSVDTATDGGPAVAEAPAVAPKQKAEPPPRTAWPAVRLALADELWGPGFIVPGGEAEILRLTRPLGASAATSLMIVGIGSGGAGLAVTKNTGAWVTGMDADPSLLAAARGLVTRAQVGKKVVIKAWDPQNPDFVEKSQHHCLALEPLNGKRPEPIIDGLARALKPGGQLVITELVANAPLDKADATVSRWAALEKRDPAGFVPGVAISRMLSRVGLDVRVAEDISARHMQQSIAGWRRLLHELGDKKPTRQQAFALVMEAELWLLRRRLIRDGRLRMMRWHAFSRVPII